MSRPIAPSLLPVIVAPSLSPLRSSVVVASSSPATAAVAGAVISYAIPEEASVDASQHDSTGAGASVAAPKSVSRQGHTLTPISHPADGHHGISHAVRPPYPPPTKHLHMISISPFSVHGLSSAASAR